jgi:hypothetical protein
VENREAFFQAAVSAKNEESALFMVEIAQMLSNYHRKNTPFVGLISAGSFVLGVTKDDNLVFPMPFDYGQWNEEAHKTFALIETIIESVNINAKFFWVKGFISVESRKKIEALGYKISENAFSDIEWAFPLPLRLEEGKN